MRPSKIRLLVTDLDNTLYDWVTYFARSFDAMVSTAAPLLEVPRDQLLDDLKLVHQRHHNSEHPFALLETTSVHRVFPNLDRAERYARLRSAFDAFNATREQTLRLYPGAQETLELLSERGVHLAAHTEATVPNALYRLRRLGIEALFSRLFAVEPSGEGHPVASRNDELLKTPIEVRFLRHDERKPDPRVLLDICSAMRVAPSEALYVGDSIARDIGMARLAGVWTAWAQYGTRFDPSDWATLVRVTHWTDEDVARAEKARRDFGNAKPHVTLTSSFAEVLDHYDFY